MNYEYNQHNNIFYMNQNKINSMCLFNEFSECKNYGLYFDINKNIIPDSIWYCNYNYWTSVKNNDVDLSVFTDYKVLEKCIAITQWMVSYGHLIDSIYNLADFYYQNNYDKLGYKVLLYIPQNFNNILEIANILFLNNLINICEDINNFLKINNLIMIKNYCGCESFLNLPINISNILHKYWNYESELIKSEENIFITRPVPQSRYRILDNHSEIENYFIQKKFTIINPDYVTNKQLYNIVKSAKNIIITNGSALCSLIFINKNSKIFCLNSRDYLPEWRRKCTTQKDVDNIIINNKDLLINDNFEKQIWKNQVNKYNFTYIDSFLNVITSEQCDYIINNLQI